MELDEDSGWFGGERLAGCVVEEAGVLTVLGLVKEMEVAELEGREVGSEEVGAKEGVGPKVG